MPHQQLARGHTTNIGTKVIATDLRITGVGAPCTISIGGGAATAHVAAVGAVDTHSINDQTVSVTNTTATPGPENLTLSW